MDRDEMGFFILVILVLCSISTCRTCDIEDIKQRVDQLTRPIEVVKKAPAPQPVLCPPEPRFRVVLPEVTP